MSQRVSPIFFVLFFLPLFSFGQDVVVVDTAAVEREVDSLSHIATELWRKGENQDAFFIVQRIVDISKQKLGENDSKYANALHLLAYANSKLGNNIDAEIFYLKAIEINANVLGKEHPDYARSLNNLAALYQTNRNYEKAEKLYLEARDIRAKSLSKKHPDYAKSLSNIATLYTEIGDYSKAEPIYIESLNIKAQTLGKQHTSYATSLYNLASLYYRKCDYEKAELLFLEVRGIWVKTIGKMHPNYASTLQSFANLYKDKGEYEKAEPLYLEAKEIQEKILGNEHPEYAGTLNDLANYYNEKGEYSKAEPLYLEAIKIISKYLGKEHPEYATPLSNLASLYISKGNYEKAESLFLEVRNIWAKTLGYEHPNYAISLFNLANFYSEKHDFDKAESLYLEASRIQINVLGKEHPDYAHSLLSLAILYSKKGEYGKSEPLYLEAKKIILKVNGSMHLDYAKVQKNLALLYQRQNQINTAAVYFAAANEINCQLIEKTSLYSSEDEITAYQNLYTRVFEQFHSFVGLYPTPALNHAIYNNVLLLKGFLIENVRRLARDASKADSLTRDTFDRWQGCQRRLAKEYANPKDKRRFITEIEAEAEAYEKTLTRKLAVFAKARQTPHWQDIRDRLSPTQAAIEFIHFRFYNPEPTDSTLYAALVLLPGDTAPHFIPLCEQRQLDAVIAGAQGDGGKIRIQDIYWPDTKSGSSLYSLIWAPLEPLLKGVKTVYFSPSGLLHRLNPGAIGKDKRTYLSDSIQFVQLGSTRQLVTGLNAGAQNVQTAVVFGGIHYEMDSTAIARANAGIPTDSTETKGSGMFKYADPAERTRGGGEKWDYLPETAVEADSIQQILNHAGVETTKYDGYKATEESFKQIGKLQPSPRILHLATHGFFFPDPKDTSAARRSALNDEPVFKISEHPMIRSGLMLAGSKHAWDTGQALEGMEDGILTAYEISQMNLSNTELVVLSACETGLGDIQGNEGVYGLQRAFKIAGVKNIVMSLWKVPEAATRELMTAFYKKWLDDKLSIRDALREAQQYVRAQPRYNSPYYWAGFVLVE